MSFDDRGRLTTMRARNLDDSGGMQVQDWTNITARLDGGEYDQMPGNEGGGPGHHTTWLVTLNADGSPHVTSVGAIWLDGAWWFQTGERTRKAKNIARDPRCSMALSVKGFDLVVEGVASISKDKDSIARVVAMWAPDWPVEVDASGVRLTAPFNAPATGPAPWDVYRIEPRSATSVSTVEPGGTTRWTF